MKKIITAFMLSLLALILAAAAVSASGCVVGTGGVPGCANVPNWGSTDIVGKVKAAAKNDPGTAYMGWCPYTGATPYAVKVKDACQCPDLKPAPGQCITGTCGSCGNPVTKCSPLPPPPSCTDECTKGATMCSSDNLLVCGNFDSDSCTEWGFKEDCRFEKSSTYQICVNEDSVTYRDVEKGYCKVTSGNDYCASNKYTEKVKTTDCGITTCGGDTYCKDDDVYSSEECTVRGCKESTGLCFTDTTYREQKVDECGSDSSSEMCDGENIVQTNIDRGCKENGNAQCYETASKKKIESCGSDICIEHTNRDVFVQEYVHDEESCVEMDYPICAYDPGDIYDYCLSTDILMQAICIGNDHAFEQYDCSQKDGCYEFKFEKCIYCEDDDGLCNGHLANCTGLEWRNYFCGNGSCMYSVEQMLDVDDDRKDDRCDDCIDVDHDGACDDVDTCVGVFNPTQVDSDNDGYGNACDDDKDGDGYGADVDCDDWNKEVHPNAREIKNNGRDDDCNPETDDKGTFAPRQALFVELDYDEAAADDTFLLTVAVTNNNAVDMNDLKITADIGSVEKTTELIKVLASGETKTKLLEIKVPKEGFTSLRVTVANDHYKRIIYREVKLD